MICAIGREYVVPGAMMAVPSAEPFGMSPAGLARNRSSSWAWEIASNCSTSYAMVISFAAVGRDFRLHAGGSGSGAMEDGLSGFLRDDVDGAHQEEPRNARENAGIDHPEPLCPMDGEFAVENAIANGGADRAGAGGMVTPGSVADVFLERRCRMYAGSRRTLLGDDAALDQRRRELADEPDRAHQGAQVEILPVGAFVEVAKVDLRWVAWIGGAQRHRAGVIVRVSFEQRPGQVVVI